MRWNFLFFLFNVPWTFCGEFNKGFDDTVLFDINWPGEKPKDLDTTNTESIVVTTSHKERYECFLPVLQEKKDNGEGSYEGPSGLELLAPLFTQSSCSYRLESYWTYEVCHGRFIRQYHEDRENRKLKLQEYTLGKWNQEAFESKLKEIRQLEKDKNYQIPEKKIDNINLPYVELTMGNGTLCDLNQNQPRQTKILYVCYIHGKHEIYSLKETSTCQYEIIILSPLLCAHPKYKPKEVGENKINCVPLPNSPSKPYNLMKMRLESAKLRRKSDLDRIRVELVSPDFTEQELTSTSKPIIDHSKPTDNTAIKDFLEGKNCLTGGSGWWQYEFCYGRHVEQYHIDKGGRRININLGKFNKAKHLDWIEKHPNKKPKPIEQRKQLSHFYSDGTICDKTGRPRQTEVKLKCLKMDSSSMNTVSLYLLEPKYCEYILGVESPLVCDILSKADENGLVDINEETAVENEIPSVKIIL